jgi:transcriptional regulator with XRE-family HTH domain/mannose-6-phosphate isomerase-like protein (cupin superfamily)
LPRSNGRANGRGNGGSPEYAEIGGRLRAVRAAQGLSLRALADRLGVSPSLISQVETGRAKPSVSTLYAITSELGISLDSLLFNDDGRPDRASGPGWNGAQIGAAMAAPAFAPVQPAATRKHIRLASGVVWERLTTVSMPNVDFLYVTYEVGGASTHEHEFQRHPGQEWGYVLSGTLGVTIGFDEYVLGPGDAISFDSTTPHRIHNLGKEPVHGIWFTLGRSPVEIGTRTTGPGAAVEAAETAATADAAAEAAGAAAPEPNPESRPSPNT